MRTPARSLVLLAAGVLLVATGCASSAGQTGSTRRASTDDARVRTFRGTVPPEIPADARFLNAPPATLATLRGRVVLLQFAFPT
jgi:hypothetical protein